MNLKDFEKAKDNFDAGFVTKSRKHLQVLRCQFVKDFSLESISKLRKEEYVENVDVSRDSFCYRIERELSELGHIEGSTCQKFGFYFSKKRNRYEWITRFGDDEKQSFVNVKNCIVELIEAGRVGDCERIKNSLLSEMFKSKILYIYYPNKYLNIFSGSHLDYFLRAFDLDTPELINGNPFEKRMALLQFKNKDKKMKEWPIDTFSNFLYCVYPRAPKNSKSAQTPDNLYDFPTITSKDISWVKGLTLDSRTTTNHNNIAITGPTDHEEQSRKWQILGDRGEKIVMMAEIDRVVQELSISKKEAEKKVVRKSLESDSYGYDILSLNPDGSKRYIEVKATTGIVGNLDFYYTINEYETAKKYGENYYLYIVYAIKTSKPKIWVLQNPFIDSSKLNMTPVKFKVQIRPEKK